VAAGFDDVQGGLPATGRHVGLLADLACCLTNCTTFQKCAQVVANEMDLILRLSLHHEVCDTSASFCCVRADRSQATIQASHHPSKPCEPTERLTSLSSSSSSQTVCLNS
jgi:hypothetical protein